MENLKLKVCGMRDATNVEDVARLGLDLMGFIFYSKSPRCVKNIGHRENRKRIIRATQGLHRVGVFVNDDFDHILELTDAYQLSYVQLHGQESPDFCRRLKAVSKSVIKAINVTTGEDVRKYHEYEDAVDLFLFDTKTPLAGGSGKQFDWTILEAYDGGKPFLLSGGIGPEDVERVKMFLHPKCIGIDLNSKFETEPGLKDVEKLRTFIEGLRKI